MADTKTCMLCKHLWIDFEGDYSDLTHGNGFMSGCLKHLWAIYRYELTEKEYRNRVLTANHCEHYDEV